MQETRRTYIFARIIAFTVMAYGLLIVAGTLVRQLQLHDHHHTNSVIVSLPVLIGISYTYLGSLLLRLKYNAWLTALILSGLSSVLGIVGFLHPHLDDVPDHSFVQIIRILLPLALGLLLIVSKSAFRVRSDYRSFRQAATISLVVLAVAFLYGIGGFLLLDKHDFHKSIGVATAIHQTLDQVGLTTTPLTPHTRRARLFQNSLSTLSLGAVAFTAIAFFQPLRQRFASETEHRELAERLLRDYPSDIDDFFKLWPHDKHYFFTAGNQAGLAYHVTRGKALVAGDPFGDPKHFKPLLTRFLELCFVNDWLPAFIHVSNTRSKLYKSFGFQLQKIGEEAVLDLSQWEATQTGKKGKYFREIRNRFTKLGYSVEIVEPPHSQAILNRLQEITGQWLQKPGRSERGFMLGYHTDEYLNQCRLGIVRDEAQQIQGFINLVPTYQLATANYDLLRSADRAPGNCNDFLVMNVLDKLVQEGVLRFNLGLSPLAGLTNGPAPTDKTIVDNALRFVYSNGDRFYSFSGLQRYKDKYQPAWEGRYIAYQGGVSGFTRILTALNRAMKIK